MSSAAHDFLLGDERKKCWQHLAIDVLRSYIEANQRYAVKNMENNGK